MLLTSLFWPSWFDLLTFPHFSKELTVSKIQQIDVICIFPEHLAIHSLKRKPQEYSAIYSLLKNVYFMSLLMKVKWIMLTKTSSMNTHIDNCLMEGLPNTREPDLLCNGLWNNHLPHISVFVNLNKCFTSPNGVLEFNLLIIAYLFSWKRILVSSNYKVFEIISRKLQI